VPAALPVIDIAAMRGGDDAARADVAARLRAACIDSGFFYIAGHGLSQVQLDGLLAAARALFALPDEEKQAIGRAGGPGSPGYARMPGDPANPKEEYYVPGAAAHDPGAHRLWPAALPGFAGVVRDHLVAMEQVAAMLTAAFALSLGLEEAHFDGFRVDPVSALRLVRYPPGAAGATPHTDFGGFTILLQDDVGGLQVHDAAADRWIDAEPVPGTFVVNIGDLIERWTNGRYRSTRHRVLGTADRERFSAPFFFSGAPDYPIRCIPACLAPGERPLHADTTVAGHLAACFAAQGF